MTNQRRFYRIPYPTSAQPVMSIKETSCRITELSEGGGRILSVGVYPALFKKPVDVKISFQSGRTAVTKAKLIRVDGDQIVLSFTPSIPLPILMEEQRMLIVQFPKD
jgi:hypothetical protein